MKSTHDHRLGKRVAPGAFRPLLDTNVPSYCSPAVIAPKKIATPARTLLGHNCALEEFLFSFQALNDQALYLA